MFYANLYPRQGFKLFQIWTNSAAIASSGRAIKTAWTDSGQSFYGVFLNSKTNSYGVKKGISETNQNKQAGHSENGVIVQYNGEPKAQAGNYLVSGEHKFYVQAVKSPGYLGLTAVYYVEKRQDLT